MAKSQIRQYVFTPSTATTNPYNGKLVVQGKYDLNQILLITNSTKNVILYNFADSTYSGTTVTFSRANDLVNYYSSLDTADGLTTINLNSVDTQTATTGMASTDSIQILYERPEQLAALEESSLFIGFNNEHLEDDWRTRAFTSLWPENRFSNPCPNWDD